VFVRESLEVKQTKKVTKPSLPSSMSHYVSHIQDRMILQSCGLEANPSESEVAREIALSRKQAVKPKQEVHERKR
jgi:hypothetical protein